MKIVIAFIGLCIVNTVNAACVDSLLLPNMPIHFYQHFLGRYTVHLSSTMRAIQSGEDKSQYPYYEKTWRGNCPYELSGKKNSCIEFTVYPNKKNFTPGNIMKKIKHYTHGKTNRGEVRIVTNNDQTQYVYTINHEKTFCGPYYVN